MPREIFTDEWLESKFEVVWTRDVDVFLDAWRTDKDMPTQDILPIVRLSRKEINRLIKILRRAQKAAYEKGE